MNEQNKKCQRPAGDNDGPDQGSQSRMNEQKIKDVSSRKPRHRSVDQRICITSHNTYIMWW